MHQNNQIKPKHRVTAQTLLFTCFCLTLSSDYSIAKESNEPKTFAMPSDSLKLGYANRIFEVGVNLLESGAGTNLPITPNPTSVQPIDNVGYFWFFQPQNMEILVKLLDIEGEYWITFASLSDIPFELVVRECDSNDSCGDSPPQVIPNINSSRCGGMIVFESSTVGLSKQKSFPGTCQADQNTHCLFNRFAVRVFWRNSPAHTQQPAVRLGNTLDSSLDGTLPGNTAVASAVFGFGLAAPQINPEVVLKVVQDLDYLLFFFGSTTSLEYDILIEDTACTTGDCTLEIGSPADPYCGGTLFRRFPSVPFR